MKEALAKNYKIITTGMLISISIFLSFIEIPYIIPYLKIDISESILLIALLLGVREAFILATVKEFFLFYIKPGDPFGVISLYIGSLFIILMFLLLKKIKIKVNFKFAFILVLYAIFMVIINYFVITPFYSGFTMAEYQESIRSEFYFNFIIITYLPFNVIKVICVYIGYLVLNKKIFKIKEDNNG